jgi:F-type H+-transporting ATPase subunit delta
VTGDFGVMPGHVPTVAQLRPGVQTIHNELDTDVEKYFVSAGFAFVHADSTADVCAVEAVKVEDLDPEAVRAGLAVSLPHSSSSLCAPSLGCGCSRLSLRLTSPLLVPPSSIQEYTGKLVASQSKGDDYETAAAQIGVEVYSAMNAAVGA